MIFHVVIYCYVWLWFRVLLWVKEISSSEHNTIPMVKILRDRYNEEIAPSQRQRTPARLVRTESKKEKKNADGQS